MSLHSPVGRYGNITLVTTPILNTLNSSRSQKPNSVGPSIRQIELIEKTPVDTTTPRNSTSSPRNPHGLHPSAPSPQTPQTPHAIDTNTPRPLGILPLHLESQTTPNTRSRSNKGQVYARTRIITSNVLSSMESRLRIHNLPTSAEFLKFNILPHFRYLSCEGDTSIYLLRTASETVSPPIDIRFIPARPREWDLWMQWWRRSVQGECGCGMSSFRRMKGRR